MWLVLAVSVATVMSTFVVLVCFLKVRCAWGELLVSGERCAPCSRHASRQQLAKRLRQRRYAQKRLSLQRAAPVDPAEAEKRRKRYVEHGLARCPLTIHSDAIL